MQGYIQNDTEPALPLTVLVNGAPVDLSAATSIQLHWGKPDGTIVLVDVVIVNAALGMVKRVWGSDDLALTGYHTGQLVVTWDDTTVQTFPDDGSNILWVVNPQTTSVIAPGGGGGGGGGGISQVFSDGVTVAGTGLSSDKLRTIPFGTAVAVDGSSIVGDGTTGNPLAAVGGGSGAGNSDGVTLTGTGVLANPYAVKAVQHDSTLTGSGTVASPLAVEADGLATALAGLVTVHTDGATVAGDGVGSALRVVPSGLYGQVTSNVDGTTVGGNGLSGTPFRVIPGGLAGAVAVSTNGTLTGNGTSGSALAVAPAALSGLVPVTTDGTTITGNGTSGSPLVSTSSAAAAIYFNVKTYGALGDNSTNDSVAIRAAITACSAAGGGVVYFPNGTYIVSEQGSTQHCISLPTGVCVLGQSRTGTVLKMISGATASHYVRLLLTVAAATDIWIDNITLDGNQSNNFDASLQSDGLFLDGTGAGGSTRIRISNCEIRQCYGDGITLHQDATQIRIYNCYIHDNQWFGIGIGNAGGQSDIIIRDCHLLGNAAGVHLEITVLADNILIDRCVCDGFTGNAGIEVAGGTSPATWVTNVVVRECQSNSIVVAQAKYVTIDSCNVVCSDTAPTPLPALKVSIEGDNILISNNTLTLTSAGNAAFAVEIAGQNPGDTLTNVNFINNTIISQSTQASGLFIQSLISVNVKGNRIFGAASTMTPYTNLIYTASSVTSQLTSTGHGLATGAGPFILVTTNNQPNGLSLNDTPYWVIVLDANNWQMASSLANALANAPITLNTNGTGTNSMVSALAGINVFSKLTRAMDRVVLQDNYITDFPICIAVTAAGSGSSTYIKTLEITRNRLQLSTLTPIAGLSLDLDGHHCVQQAMVSLNENVDGSIATMFATFPNVPMLVDGTRGAGAKYNCNGSPLNVIVEAVGATATRRDGGAGTTLYVKESGGGANTGWVAK